MRRVYEILFKIHCFCYDKKFRVKPVIAGPGIEIDVQNPIEN
jgi:hypothetical protein